MPQRLGIKKTGTMLYLCVFMLVVGILPWVLFLVGLRQNKEAFARAVKGAGLTLVVLLLGAIVFVVLMRAYPSEPSEWMNFDEVIALLLFFMISPLISLLGFLITQAVVPTSADTPDYEDNILDHTL